MRQFRTTIAALTAAGVLTTITGDARANDFETTTTTAAGVVTTAGVVVLIYFLVIKKPEAPATTTTPAPSSPPPANPPPPPPAAPGAMLFLRDTGPQLAQDLALGHGPILTDLADALEVPATHRQAFNRTLCAHRAQLLDLADPAGISPERGIEFLSALMSAITSDRTLASDIDAWTVHMNHRFQS